MGDSGSGSSFSLNRSVLGEINLSEVLEQPRHMALSYVKHTEKWRSDGALQLACGGDPSSSLKENSASMNSEVDIFADSPRTEMLVGNISKKKKKKKGKSTKSLNDKTVDGTGLRKCGLDSAMASCQPSGETPTNYVKGLKNDLPSAGVNPQCAPCMSVVCKDPSAPNGKNLPEYPNVRIPDLTGNYLPAATWNQSNSGSNICCVGSEFSKHEPEEVSKNCFLENQSPRVLSQCKSCKAKDCTGCNRGVTKTFGRSQTAWNLRGITPINDLASQSDVVHKTNCHISTWIGRENSHLGWKKNKMNAKGAQTYVKKRSNFYYMERDIGLLEKNLWVKRNSLSSRGLLPSHLNFPPGYSNTAHGTKKMVNNGGVIVDSSQLATQQRLNGGFHKYVSCSSQPGALGTDWERSKSYNSFRHENYYNRKKGHGGYGGNFFRLHDKSVPLQKESSQVPYELYQYKNGNAAQRTIYNSQLAVSYGSNCLNSFPAFSPVIQQNVPRSTSWNIPGQHVLNDFRPYNCMKIPMTEDVVSRFFSASIDSDMCSHLKFHNEDKYRQNGAIGKKWVPVGTKRSRLLKQTSSAGESRISESSIAEVDGQKVESTKDSVIYGEKTKLNPRVLIGSRMASEALKAAYQLQLASEGIHYVMGYPLAEFERLIHSFAPVISSSCVYEKCAVCIDKQLSHSLLCKHQAPNVSLDVVWNWYEKPGNYGLEVKAEDLQNLNGLHSDSISFHAHFVPFLSAVQLFGYRHLPEYSDESREHTNLEMQDKGEVGPHFSFPKTLFAKHSEAVEVNRNSNENMEPVRNFDSVQEPVSSSKVSPCKESDSSNLDSLSASFDTELVFEFFESDQPQYRKPLHEKIVELVDIGTSSRQIYGDPSNLELMNLQELHPASWFSVAWYPIYRIPEGNFRASFLTFHSLGHLVQRHILSDSLNKNAFCIVSPVLGLQSYNTQGECWFDPKIPVETTLKESTPSNGSEILKERLRTLEENALLFARGCVRKNNVMAFNRQPDYEFFSSRKN
ncbi:uncharacterized protein LOC132180275 [Corylus avellana]|uniref:uncharacterized protein LOC132180275 n=1 Tax=Corylus avellana TaxID=13451 RepID=UPI00286BAFF3|nr:uncharacterized protein LOC132180275 [Corylus avellana]